MNLMQSYRNDISLLQPEVEKLLGKSSDRFIRTVFSYLSNNPKLLEVDKKSFLAAMMEVAALDLEIGVLGQADIIPFKGRAKLIIGYQGYLTLIYRSGMVKTVFANVVRKRDKFSITYGSNGTLKHTISLSSSKNEDNAIVGAYAYAELITGGEYYDYMPLEELERIRRYSQNSNGNAWTQEREWMFRKTMIRQLIKLLPKFKNEAAILKAIKLDEASERNAITVEDDYSLSVDYTEAAPEEVISEIQAAKQKAADKVVKRLKKQPQTQPQETTPEDDPIILKINKSKSVHELKQIYSSLTELEQPIYLDKIAERKKDLEQKDNSN